MKKWQTFILLWFFNLKKIVKNYLRTLKKPFAANFKRLCQNSKEYGVVAAINIIMYLENQVTAQSYYQNIKNSPDDAQQKTTILNYLYLKLIKLK